MRKCHPIGNLPTNKFTTFTTMQYGDKYLTHFFTTNRGKVLNFKKITAATQLEFVTHCDSTIFGVFSFDDELVMAGEAF